MSRRGLLAVTDAALAKAKRQREGKLGAYEAPASFSFPELPDDIRTVLRGERETLGQYVSDHPLHVSKRADNSETAARVNQGGREQWLSGVGLLSETWSKPTRRGSIWGGGVFEDLSGRCQVIAFGETAEALREGLLVSVRGVTDERDGSPALKITDLKVLEEW